MNVIRTAKRISDAALVVVGVFLFLWLASVGAAAAFPGALQ